MKMDAKPQNQSAPIIAKRPASVVMKLARMGSLHQSRLSFMRVLLRRLKAENWQFRQVEWSIDEQGVGVASYEAIGPERTYTLVAFAHDLPAEQRSDRVIAEAWDATFTLHDGVISQADIARLAANVPRQEAGRISGQEFVLSRANRSVRLFDYVVTCLANGQQPDLREIEPVGYLMRTTAVYGSGKFGAADRALWADRPEFAGSFQPELLAVWLIRSFTIDIAEHMARQRAPDRAIRLDPNIRRRIGVGNSTGLGMAPFLINHPALVHAWINAREAALTRVRNLPASTAATIDDLTHLTQRALQNAIEWTTDSPYQQNKTVGLRDDLASLIAYLKKFDPATAYPFNELYEWGARQLSLEGQEQFVSLLIDSHAALIDDLAATMSADESAYFHIDGSITIGKIKTILDDAYGWVKHINYADDAAIARVWYVSEEKLEPRLGERFNEPIEPFEQPLAPGRDAVAARACLDHWDDAKPIASFLLAHPEHRHIIRRTQIVASLPYAEIQDNTIAAEMRPIDLLRCKLSFFGASKFDPRSDRWLRITMYQGAPFPDELARLDPDELAYPTLSS